MRVWVCLLFTLTPTPTPSLKTIQIADFRRCGCGCGCECGRVWGEDNCRESTPTHTPQF